MFEQLVWFVPAAVAALGVWRPRAGLLLLAAALPVFGSPPGGPYLAALDTACVAAILTAWRGGRPRPSPLMWPLAAFVAVGVLTLIPSPYSPPSWQPPVLFSLLKALPAVESWSALYTWRAALDLVLGLGLFLAVRRAFDGHTLKPLAFALLAGLGGTLLLGLASFASLVDLGEFRPLRTTHTSFRRMSSVFFLSGWLSQYIVLTAPLALTAVARCTNRARRFVFPTLALVSAGLLLTKQRGAWVAAGIQLAVWAAIQLRRRSRQPERVFKTAGAAAATVALAMALVVASGSPVDSILERAGSVQSGFSGRLPLWSTATVMIRERPLLGWGHGSFSPAYDLLYPIESPDAHRFRGSAHNLYLQIAAESGLPGLLALGLIAWTAALCLRRPRPDQQAFALALGISLVGAATYGLVQHLFHLRAIGWLLWILLGCVALVTDCERAPRIRRGAQGLIAMALLMLPLRLGFAASPPYGHDKSFGFHQVEPHPDGDFRWTDGFAAQLLPWKGKILAIELANGHPRASEHPVTVIVGLDGNQVAHTTITGGWQELRFDVGPPRAESILLTFKARPTFRPFSDFRAYPKLRRSTDIRSLGVAVKNIRWVDEADD